MIYRILNLYLFLILLVVSFLLFLIYESHKLLTLSSYTTLVGQHIMTNLDTSHFPFNKKISITPQSRIVSSFFEIMLIFVPFSVIPFFRQIPKSYINFGLIIYLHAFTEYSFSIFPFYLTPSTATE